LREHSNGAPAGLIEVWIDETARRTCSCLGQPAAAILSGIEASVSYTLVNPDWRHLDTVTAPRLANAVLRKRLTT
jgi:hypothetical protein